MTAQHVAQRSDTPTRARILLVDDHADACTALARVLQAHGFTTSTACDATQALLQLRSGPPPDFIVTDLRLPDLDGRELARIIRDECVPAPSIMLMTGWDVDDDLVELDRWGIERVFLKPIDFRALIESLKPSTAETVRSQAPEAGQP